MTTITTATTTTTTTPLTTTTMMTATTITTTMMITTATTTTTTMMMTAKKVSQKNAKEVRNIFEKTNKTFKVLYNLKCLLEFFTFLGRSKNSMERMWLKELVQVFRCGRRWKLLFEQIWSSNKRPVLIFFSVFIRKHNFSRFQRMMNALMRRFKSTEGNKKLFLD